MRHLPQTLRLSVLSLFLALTGPATLPAGTVQSRAEKAPTDDIKLTARFDRTSVAVGDLVTLTLRYALPQGAILPENTSIKGLESLTVVKRTQSPETIVVTVLADKLGTLTTGPIAVGYVDKEGKHQTLAADPVSITVSSVVQTDTTGNTLKPIKGIIATRPIWRSYWPWALGVSGMIIIIAGVVWWSRKGRIQPLTPDKIDPPHLVAEREIERLLAGRLFEKGQVKAFYFSFSEILRRYLGAIRGFPAVELTTEEIVRRVHHDDDQAVLALLRAADLVKFADYVPPPARQQEQVDQALDYIRRTAPAPETQASAPDASTTGRATP
ncbi:MAG: hypothetical protein JRI36_10560 [Deltaproteobacteria bacterium]|nr:hypothetical protein [Deltaproteobacteria bacterium]